MALGASLPGPSSTQLVLALGLVRGGLLGGVLSFSLFAFPAALTLLVLVTILWYSGAAEVLAQPAGDGGSPLVHVLTDGMAVAAVALMGVALGKLALRLLTTALDRATCVATCCALILYTRMWMFPLLIFVAAPLFLCVRELQHTSEGSLASSSSSRTSDHAVPSSQSHSHSSPPSSSHPPDPQNFSDANDSKSVEEDEEARNGDAKPSTSTSDQDVHVQTRSVDESVHKSGNTAPNEPEDRMPALGYGLRASALMMAVYAITVLAVLGLNTIASEHPLVAICTGALLCGSLVVGGGYVVIPMLASVFVSKGLMTEALFYSCFALINALPGPMFNVSILLGGVAAGPLGALVCWASLFGPGLLFKAAALPLWSQLRERPRFQAALQGACAAALGFLSAAMIMSWNSIVLVGAPAAASSTGASIRIVQFLLSVGIATAGPSYLLPPSAVACSALISLIFYWIEK